MEKTIKEPNDLKNAMKSLQSTLPKTMYVGSGYGYNDLGEKSRLIDPYWFLRVYTDDKDTSMVPSNWNGYPVDVQSIPRTL
jgi:hypothetical protein